MLDSNNTTMEQAATGGKTRGRSANKSGQQKTSAGGASKKTTETALTENQTGAANDQAGDKTGVSALLSQVSSNKNKNQI